MTTKKRILRSKILRPVLNHIYKDSDNCGVEMCTGSDIFIRRYEDKKNHRKEDANKYYT